MRTALSRKRAKSGAPCSNENGITDVESLLRQTPGSIPGNKSSPPRVPVKVLFNKIFLAPDRDEQGRGGFIRLLQDILGGIVLGTFGMSVLLFLDYSNLINLETARVFRKTASDLFNDREIIESIEEEIEKKLVPMEAYDAMKKELLDSQVVLGMEAKIYEARSMKVTLSRAELDLAREEYSALMKETGLDEFCPDCKWGMGMNCQKRVEYMLEKYSDTATTIGCIGKLVQEAKTKGNGRCLTPN